MKPYYQDTSVIIYHGNCRKILLNIKEVDLVITDPPYGMEYHSNYYKYGNPWDELEGDSKYPVDVLNMCLITATHAVFSFCRWDKLPLLPKPKSVIAWVKNTRSAGDLKHEYAHSWEAIAFYPCRLHEFQGRPQDIILVNAVDSSKFLHPTEKPVELIKWLITHNKGNLILDPFMGSGVTLRAAKDLGKKAIGIEIEEQYCEVAANRCRQEVLW